MERVEYVCSEMVVNNMIGEVEIGKGKRKKRKCEFNDGEIVKECKVDNKCIKKSLFKVVFLKIKILEFLKKKKKKKNRVILKFLFKI